MPGSQRVAWRRYRGTSLALILGLVIVIGVLLRIASFSSNGCLQGDVNLFALTAREFVQHDRLYYPMKYEFSENVPYKTLASPASQHPLLWPLAAGLLGKVLSTDATFPLLKLLSEAVGVGMLMLIGVAGWRQGNVTETPVALTLCALSPILVDFSGNGSPYILIALILLCAAALMSEYNPERRIDYVLAGFLCAISLQVHSITVLLPAAFLSYWRFVRGGVPWRGAALAALSGFLTLLPWMVWNYAHFGRLFYSYSTLYFLKQFGFAEVGLVNGTVSTYLTARPVDTSFVIDYARQALLTTVEMVRSYYDAVGPFSLFLLIAGGIILWRRDRRLAIALFLPAFCYALTVVMWATWRDRFVVPLVPVTCLGAAAGFAALLKGRRLLQGMGWIFVTAALLWNVNGLLRGPATYYYRYSSSHAASYAAMLSLVKEMGAIEKGTILGYSQALDGGTETVYWHRRPFVYGRELPLQTVAKVIEDFGIRYIWVDSANYGLIRSNFPDADEIRSNREFHLFELPRPSIQLDIPTYCGESALQSRTGG